MVQFSILFSLLLDKYFLEGISMGKLTLLGNSVDLDKLYNHFLMLNLLDLDIFLLGKDIKSSVSQIVDNSDLLGRFMVINLHHHNSILVGKANKLPPYFLR